MTAVGEDKKKFPGSAVAWAKWGLGGLGGKTVKLQGVEKPYLLKQTVWNGIFSPQIKMLKHNKCTVHLTSSHATQSPPCPAQGYYFYWAATGFRVLCFGRSARVHMYVCVRVCTRVHWDKKIIETGGFGIRLSVCSSTPAPAPCPPPNPPPF